MVRNDLRMRGALGGAKRPHQLGVGVAPPQQLVIYNNVRLG